MGWLRKDSGVQVSVKPAGAHTGHLNRNTVQNAKKAAPRAAAKEDLVQRGRDAGASVKRAAADATHARSMLSFRRPPRG